ncbi:GNAT family N-acetyltransferase [Hymenobacter latericus]|uniref:GNAT family N-acetyltransferase n=1 Tax=Hymenobacter sp. YIM 151858-1 TaxID=2987688 RepID=UPI002225BF0A|nr:GNAT family N-acetyltransferase [Hymenobacter sp. YIM 151858-1]UYZ57766.1 GNAT family N-acetyltransferase [Hymenobacter sp. YIM 151858-1]
MAAWQACVAQAEQCVPYAQALWLDATNGPTWAAVVETLPGGGYASVFPVPVRRRWWGAESLQPPFTQQLGLLTTAASQHRHPEEYLALLANRFVRLHLQLNTHNPPPGRFPPGWCMAERTTYHLGLAADYHSLLLHYTPEFRRRLRQHRERAVPLQIVPGASLAPTITLFRSYKPDSQTRLRKGHFARLQRLVEALGSQAQLLEVRQPGTGELLAGALFVHSRGRITYLFAAASAAGKKQHAPMLLLDYVIARHAGTPNLVLDFEGGTIPSIARFFANFGARPVPYCSITQTTRPWYLTWMR